MTQQRMAWGWLGACLVVACSSDHAQPAQRNPDGGAASSAAQQLTGCNALELPGKSYDAKFQLGMHLEPGEEHEVCALHKTENQDTLYVNASDLAMSTGSHHGLLWLTSYTSLPDTDRKGDPIQLDTLVPCEGSANSRFDVSGVLAGSEGRTNLTADGVLPDDVALKLPANSYVVTNFHMLNSSDNPVDACMKVGLKTIPASQVQHEAGVLFFYDPFIAVARGTSASARMACPISQDISIKSAVSHMHKLGVNYTAKLLDGDPLDSGSQMVDMLYQTNNWDSPAAQVWDDPINASAGQWIDYQCDYENTSDRDVAQGLDATDEMCMFVGMYWPVSAAQSFCQSTSKGATVGSSGYQIGQGTLDGSGFLGCLLTQNFSGGAAETLCGYDECKDYAARFSFQSCFVNACPAIGKFTRPYLNCFSANSSDCSSQCQDNDNRTSCILSCLNDDHCKSEADALLQSKCE